MHYAIEMCGVDKCFGGTYALKHVDFCVEAGTCHGLVGENGAGKSTLMKILDGIIRKDAGTISVFGVEQEKGLNKSEIALVPQELSFISNFTVAENIFLGMEPVSKTGVVNKKKIHNDAEAMLKKLKINLDPDKIAGDLNVSQQQMMVIARILARNASIIIMDEPTARLGHHEIQHLLEYIKYLKNQGKTIILITHHLDEVMEVCDNVTVLRDGNTIMTAKTADVTQDILIQKMVNRQINESLAAETDHDIGEVMLKVQDLNKGNQLQNICFEVHRGEIVGFFGLVGAGRTEAIRAMMGIDKCDSVKIELDGKECNFNNNRQAIQSGIVLVPEERRKQGLILNLTIRDNINLGNLNKAMKVGILNRKMEQASAQRSSKEMNVHCQSIFQKAGDLSGGNQQKVVLAKYVEKEIKVFILDEPTRGIDVGAKEQIYEMIDGWAKKHIAIIVISSEIPELQRLCDVVYIMSEGKIVKKVNRKELLDAESILQYALPD